MAWTYDQTIAAAWQENEVERRRALAEIDAAHLAEDWQSLQLATDRLRSADNEARWLSEKASNLHRQQQYAQAMAPSNKWGLRHDEEDIAVKAIRDRSDVRLTREQKIEMCAQQGQVAADESERAVRRSIARRPHLQGVILMPSYQRPQDTITSTWTDDEGRQCTYQVVRDGPTHWTATGQHPSGKVYKGSFVGTKNEAAVELFKMSVNCQDDYRQERARGHRLHSNMQSDRNVPVYDNGAFTRASITTYDGKPVTFGRAAAAAARARAQGRE
jgi:hypothetical protein